MPTRGYEFYLQVFNSISHYVPFDAFGEISAQTPMILILLSSFCIRFIWLYRVFPTCDSTG